jgi:hypothetical protein
MSDFSVRGSSPSPAPVSTNNPETVEMNSPPVSHEPVHSETKIDSSSPKPPINNQHGAAMKDDKSALGTFKQNELNQKLAAGKAQIKEFPPQAGNKELDKIHVLRYKNNDQVSTQFPTGVKYKQIQTAATHSNDVREVSSKTVRLQKAGSETAIEIEAPPGGKISAEKDGKTIISDAKGKVVATVDKDGTLQTQSKEGKYTASRDGKIKFEQTLKGDLSSLRKPAHIDPSNYENYGITTDGKTLRFPNGVEVTKEPRNENIEAPKIHHPLPPADDVTVRVPKDLGLMRETFSGQNRYPDIEGWAHGGERLVDGTKNFLTIETPGGTFHYSPTQGIDFSPKQ